MAHSSRANGRAHTRDVEHRVTQLLLSYYSATFWFATTEKGDRRIWERGLRRQRRVRAAGTAVRYDAFTDGIAVDVTMTGCGETSGGSIMVAQIGDQPGIG